MKRTPLFSGIIYIILGILFTLMAIQNTQNEQTWGMFTYLFIIIATMDLGTGLRLVAFHFKIKNSQPKK
ncbi:YdiK family protein [Cytobacillus dafuensis]|uniref:DUF4305 domain-containing protein n=1 Tax=Cytobacillus dafuensis TaxID=1742359 RepID=A0A5B8Z291_CYTDA|nr:YdiK family protein [Cytobacillus dafuensis]QED46383.1 DUF4305 domain-containing protein [Cytobacillus dafuensis]